MIIGTLPLADQENIASADTFEEENSNVEVQTVLEQLMQMQDLSDDDDEDDIALERNSNVAKEKVVKKKAIEESINPYVRRSLRVYSIQNPSLGNIVDQDIWSSFYTVRTVMYEFFPNKTTLLFHLYLIG